MTHPRPRVLVADDYPDLITAISQLLARSCDIVGHVADGAELVEAVARHRPDVVVVDVNLPGMNGLDACRKIREAHQGTAVILVSATFDSEVQTVALAAGASAFISKFVIADELEAAVAQAYGKTLGDSSAH
jgi:CheY-like chemotaxis protein